MPRKPDGHDEGQPNDLSARGVPEETWRNAADAYRSVGNMTMTTSPAFDAWLDRQMKSLIAACDGTPDRALTELVRSEFAKRESKVTD